VPRELFGICVVGTSGSIYTVGDADYEFTIMSVSKPFVFALVCQAVGVEEERQRIGVNATGLAFNSLAVMLTAGLYETSGDWLYDIGLPGKSGIGGGMVAVAPGKGGLGTFAPPLDQSGNSGKVQLVAKFLPQRVGLDFLVSRPEA
jgi:glutaminase